MSTAASVGLGLGHHARTLTLPRQLHQSSSPTTAPLLRYPPSAHSRSQSSSLHTPYSRPPSPVLNALHEALTEDILPSPPPPAKLASASSPSPLSRSPPLMSTLRYTSPSASPPTTFDYPITLTLSPRVSFPANASSTCSSVDVLRSIHTSAVPQIPPSPSLLRWWPYPDSDARENVAGVLSESDLLDGDLGKKFRAPKAPLVFCHGLLGFDSVTIGPAIAPLQVSHWRGIKEVLEAIGCEVLITRVPATSSPIDRAKVLEKKISETYPGRAVHLIGHSMGGIDCRYLITHLTQRKFRVLSLTTIATPHRGSSFASHFLSLASAHLPSVLTLLELLPNGGGDGKAFECLTRDAMSEFNDSTPDVEGVRYFSWGAEYEPGLIDTWKYPHSIIAAQEGPNDGLVSVQSAQWGRYLGTLHNVNHLDLVGWTGGLAGNITSIAGFSDMPTFIVKKDVGFSAGRFYGSIADSLARLEEEEGHVDGKWAGWENEEETRKGAEANRADNAGIIKPIASDKERWKVEEVSRPAIVASPSRSDPCPEERAETRLEVQEQEGCLTVTESEGSQDPAEGRCIVSDSATVYGRVRRTTDSQDHGNPNSPIGAQARSQGTPSKLSLPPRL